MEYNSRQSKKENNSFHSRTGYIFLCILLVIVVTLTGCDPHGTNAPSSGIDDTGGSISETPESGSGRNHLLESPVLASENGIITIRDCENRQVELLEQPQRIAVLDSFAGEAVVMIGAGEKMVTCPNGVKSDRLLCEMYPALNDVPVVMSGGSFNAEALLALSPDVIIVKQGLISSEEERAKLDRLKLPYLVSGYQNMQEQIYAIRMIGCVAGGTCGQKAEEIAAYYTDVMERIEEKAATIPAADRKKVYHSINEAVRTDGEDSLGNDWISCTGAIDVSAEQTSHLQKDGVDYYAAMEQIFEWDPDVIICNEVDTKAYLLSDSKWTGLRAVREQQVYNIPVGATRWGQRGSLETFFAMIWLGVTLYPNVYDDFDLKAEVTSFYGNILGIAIDNETYEQMLSGTGIRNASNASGA